MKRVDSAALPAFKPFSLLIETEAEATLIAGLVGACTGSTSQAISGNRDTSQVIYDLIADHNPRVSVTISVNK